MNAETLSPAYDPRAQRRQRLHVVAVGASGAALTADIAPSDAVQVERVEPPALLECLRALVETEARQTDSVLVLVHQHEDMRELEAGAERWQRSGPLITTIFVQGTDGGGDGHWTLDGNLMLLRAMSDQLVITADAGYPAEVVRALTH